MSPPSPLLRRRRQSVLVAAADLERLIAECDDALLADPACLHARSVRGHANLRAKRWAKAARDLSEVLAARPDDVHARFSRGLALFKAERVDEALRDFSRVLELQPAHAMARFARAGCYNAEGEYNEAIKEYWLALRLDEESGRLVDGHHRFDWPGARAVGSTLSLPSQEQALAAADAVRSDPSRTQATVRSSETPTGSGQALERRTLAQPETRRAARKVVQVRVNLSQFAPSTTDSPASASVLIDPSSALVKASAQTAQSVAPQGGDRRQTVAHRSSDTRPIAAPQPLTAVEQDAATPPVRSTPRAVRRVTVVL